MRYRLPVLDGINKETEELARKHCKYSQEAWVRGCVTGRISNLSGSGFLTNERAISLVSEARQSSRRLDTARSQRPTFPEISQTSVGGHATKEVPNVLAGAARPGGLQTYGREWLNHLTKITDAIVVSRRCFICLHAWSSARLAVESMMTTLTHRRALRFWYSWGLVD